MYSKKEVTARVLLDKLQKATGKTYIFIHKSMDGDCIGASCGLCEVIRNLGFDASVAISEPIQDKMAFLNIENYVEAFMDEEKIANAKTDLVIAVDCNEAHRMGDAGAVFEKSENRVIVDHHITDMEDKDEYFIVPEASSASELAFYLSEELVKLTNRKADEIITKFASQLFLTGIITDTGRFSYTNTRPETLVAASRLMSNGADITSVMYYFFDWKSKEEFLVSSAASSTARFDLDGKIASVAVKNELFEKYNASVDQIGEVVSKLRDVDGVVVAFVLRELGNNKVRVNIRSQEPFDCASFAAMYNGGGHLRAAGCTIEGDIDVIREEIVGKAIEFLKV